MLTALKQPTGDIVIAAMENKRKLLVLYATETGNAQDVAERIAREAERRYYAPVLQSTASYEPSALPSEENVIIVASTCGQGDPPAAMKVFWRQLLRKSLGQDWLEGMHYAVFGLGDSGYQKYNLVAKKLDRRLSDLGAKPIVPKGLGDDQHRSGYEAALDPWLANLWTALRERIALPYGLQDPDNNDMSSTQLDCPKFSVKFHNSASASQMESLTIADIDATRAVQEKWVDYQKARVMLESAAGDAPTSMEPEVPGYGPDQPMFAKMTANKRLTAEDHSQNVRHLEFDLGPNGVKYHPGDILTLIPRQNPDDVEAFLQRLSLDGDSYVTVEASQSELTCSWNDPQLLQLGPVKLRTLVEGVLDVSSASPRRYFFEVMSHFAAAEHEKERLQYFATSEGRDDLYQYNQRERRSVLEVLLDFPSVQLPLEWVLQIVPRLKPRSFSIASSQRAHPQQAHLTMAVVEWMTPFKRKRHGLCSTWLAQLDPSVGEVYVPVWITRGALKLPPPSVPLILVGPGTGCAPFRSFVEDRNILSQTEPVAPILFFFGCRNQAKDYLYKDFWQSCTTDHKVMSPDSGGGLHVAFSRDQGQKVYVQHKIRENRKLVWRLLQSGAAIFISGSANKMPAQVTSAFEEIIASEAGISREAAIRWLKQMELKGRFSVEAWS
ncbi:hypothetical protein MPTK1_8g02140 [Marchantia polymorpha subsp. ruderalis]|uniref:NADPH-dependent diflavin oxidoreductase 1 n=3 Tax=Marchantia polymorpha TaxID=3197 RepID=A0A176WJC7_MARPO|nr:hypothetical protein AXG93_3556s1130 [Marchantia polymorpha subsp. ruderalis]PTQ46031.1 hypothetical protein MARPO_0012s0011 [Marchantia polymorpha]BBN18381.1 hypothetical protein Mp_8g02140 [Marchantia polymorpha subsp. ruderalis]|eukprot:PTQ46031.1 hypothetical protein MARPO_0012s0011 [Marchantia polymorpha]